MLILSEIFKEREFLKSVSSHKKAIQIALEKAKKIGDGSSRAVFELQDPEYGETVIKIAKNTKGLEQNKYELDILLKESKSFILPKLYDYDKDSIMSRRKNNMPLWLQVDKATDVSRDEFEKIIELEDEWELAIYLLYKSNKPKFEELLRKGKITLEDKNKLNKNEGKLNNNNYVKEILKLAINYDIAVGDLATYRNFGIKDGSLLLIDIGASNDIVKKYYPDSDF